MSLIKSLPRHARSGAAVAAAALVVAAVLQLTHEQSSESTTVGIEHLGLAAFSVSWLALVPAILELGRRGAPRAAAVAATGQTVLGLLAVVSNVNGEDPSFFAAVAAPSNLAIFGGWIAMAVILRRGQAIPTWFAIALPVAFVGMIPLATVGGGILSAAIWGAYARPVVTRSWPARSDRGTA